jgi:hypothetical protein
VPAATTLNRAVCPVLTVRLAGWVVIWGGVLAACMFVIPMVAQTARKTIT